MVRRAVLVIALWAVSFAVYMGNGETISSYDALPATLFTFNAIENGTPYFDRFRNGYIDAIGAGYAFADAPNGHYASIFPIGTALVTAPAFAAIYAVRTFAGHAPPPILSAAFEDERKFDEKLVAAAFAAAAVALCFLTLRLFATPLQAAVGTFAFGFASEMWTIGSQGLWQHGPVNLALLATVFALLRGQRANGLRASGWITCAGLGTGLLVAIRPTSALIALAVGIFIASQRDVRRQWLAFAGGALAGVAPALGWNLLVFHSLAGGYGVDAAHYDPSVAHASIALAGLLLSASRGLLVFSPVVICAVAGAVRAARRPEPAARLTALLSAAGALLVVQYACYTGWIGGACYGPRFLTDVAAITTLALVEVVPARLDAIVTLRQRAGAVALCLLLAASSIVQIVGSYSGAAGPIWNAIPIDVGIAPERIWSWHDHQIERNARAMFFRYAPVFPTAGAAYAGGYGVRVANVDVQSLPNGRALIRATLVNTGRSVLYGYDTAVYNGESRVDVSFVRAGAPGGALPIAPQDLYLAGRIVAGGRGELRGVVTLPGASGAIVVLRPYALGIDRIPKRHLQGVSVVLNKREARSSGGPNRDLEHAARTRFRDGLGRRGSVARRERVWRRSARQHDR